MVYPFEAMLTLQPFVTLEWFKTAISIQATLPGETFIFTLEALRRHQLYTQKKHFMNDKPLK